MFTFFQKNAIQTLHGNQLELRSKFCIFIMRPFFSSRNFLTQKNL